MHDSSVTFDIAAQALSGTWDMLTVTTLGYDEGPQRWKLRFVLADSAARNPCLMTPCRRPNVQNVVVGAPLGKTPFDSLRVTKNVVFVARYDKSNNHLTLNSDPWLLDGGTFYAVTEVSDSTIVGRWVDGSYLAFFVRRGDVTTLEHPQGFFCGRKARPTSS